MALVMASHAGTGALWLDTNTGRWCSSAYYKEIPDPVSRGNYRQPLSSRIDTVQWKPMLPLDRYPGLPAQKRYYEFRHTFPSKNKDVYEQFAASPKGNTEVTNLAIDYLKSLKLGNRGDAIDMLCLGYTAAPFKWVKDGDYRLELSDTYLRLDKDLERLFAEIDKSVGLQNAVIFICSTGYYDDATPDDPKYRVPTGTFSAKKALSLLNAFLTARYGQGNWVDAYYDRAFYFNRKLMEQKGVDPQEADRLSKEFLSKMSGVDAVYTISDLLNASSPEEEALRVSVDPRTAPDLLIEVAPGWMLTDDTVYPAESVPVRRSTPAAPFMMLSPSLKAQRLESADATALAPTVTTHLRLRAPNGAAHKPLLP